MSRLPGHTWTRWAAVVVLGLAAGVTTNQFTPRLSAQALLERSVSFERERSPLTTQRIGIRVGGPLAETLPCAVSARSHVAARSAAFSEAGSNQSRGLLASRVSEWESSLPVQVSDEAAPGLNSPASLCSNLGLSARRFLAWSSMLREPDERVTEDARSTVVTIESRDGALRRATLTMKRETHQPIAQRLIYDDQSEVEIWLIGETIVAPPSAPLRVAEHPAVTASPAPPVAVAIDVDDTEMEVRARLHQLGADLGEDVSVRRRADGSIDVKGTVQTGSRLAELARALDGLPRVAVLVRAPSERDAVVTGPTVAVAPAALKPPVLAAWLQKAFASSAAREEYVTRAVMLSDKLTNHALALGALADRYPPAAVAGLSPRATARLDAIVHDHQSGLRNAAAELVAHVTTFMPERDRASDGVRSDVNNSADCSADTRDMWQGRASRDLAAARHAGQAILDLLTTHNIRVSTPHDARVAVASGCGHSDHDLDAFSPIARLDASLRRLGVE